MLHVTLVDIGGCHVSMHHGDTVCCAEYMVFRMYTHPTTMSKIVRSHKTTSQEYNCIVMRGGVYDEILPEGPEGFPEGSGNILSYTPTRVTIQSFSITSTSKYFLVLNP